MSVPGNLGFPRIGRRRELKFALEDYWAGRSDEAALQAKAAELRAAHWDLQQGKGIAHLPSNDFSLYDHVLDTAAMLGAIPPGYGWEGGPVPLDTYFALARGTKSGLTALEMTKWFDTNYHYLVPVLSADQRFGLTVNGPLAAFREAHGAQPAHPPGPARAGELPRAQQDARRVRSARFARPRAAGLCRAAHRALRRGSGLGADGRADPRARPARGARSPRSIGPIARSRSTASRPCCSPAISARPVRRCPCCSTCRWPGSISTWCAAPKSLAPALEARDELWLSLGVVDGRNVWRTDLRAALATLRRAAARRGTARLMVAPSCSLLHVPVDLAAETALPKELASWLAFGAQKLQEVTLLARGLDEGDDAIGDALAASDAAKASHRASPLVHDPAVAARLAAADARAGTARQPLRRAADGTAGAHPAPGLPDHDDRLAAADQGHPRRPRGACAGNARPGRLRRGDRGLDRGSAPAPGGGRARRAGAWRVRAQRHGEVFRRAARRLRLHRAWLGAILWQPLRGAADHLWRRLAPGADDAALDRLCAEPYRSAGQGHADGAGDDAAMVLRANRHPARDRLPADRARAPRRARRSGGGRNRHHPARRAGAARGPAAARGGAGGLSRLGGRQLPPGEQRDRRCDPVAHPYVLLRFQRHPARDRRARRRRDQHRGDPLPNGAARGVPRRGLSQRDRARGVGHPQPARAG